MVNTQNDSIMRLQFSNNGNSLFFSNNIGKYYKVDISDSLEIEIFETSNNDMVNSGFDVSHDEEYLAFSDFVNSEMKSYLYSLNSTNTIELSILARHPRFSPINHNNIIYTPSYFGDEGLRIINTSSDSISSLETRIFEYSSSHFPYWSFNEGMIVFAAAKLTGDPLSAKDYEIWILEGNSSF